MKLHVFNPEHDLALANNDVNFVPPHAARQMGFDLSFIQTLWADGGDAVMVEDRQTAEKALSLLRCKKPDVKIVTKDDIKSLDVTYVDVWGWDPSICKKLHNAGVKTSLLCDKGGLENIRNLSNRSFAGKVLKTLKDNIDGLCGSSRYCTSMQEVEEQIYFWDDVVLKAPWSSSGRGLRFAKGKIEPPLTGWCKNLLLHQGGISVEPYYNKVKDFGVEFSSDGHGKIKYEGLSLFTTVNGAYTGNILASEEKKRGLLSAYLPLGFLDLVINEICNILAPEFCGKYAGPFGVDMMIVSGRNNYGFMLHPCVEINLRRTMGHVSLHLSKDEEKMSVMSINYNKNYKIKIMNL